MPNKSSTRSNWMFMTLRLITSLLCLLPLVAQASLLLSLRGEPAPGALLVGKTTPGVEVRLEQKALRVTDDGWFVFGFGRDDEGVRTLTLQLGDAQETHTLQLQPRQWNIQRVEGVPKETVSPPPETLARIREEAALVRAARKRDSDRRDFLADFVWPASGPITGIYGSQRFYNGEPRNPHYGVDIAAPTGSPVVAPADGVVTLVHPDMFFSGGTLLVDHGYGVSSTFIHLHRVLVKEGQEVKQGEKIAEIGASGRATGPHLDWRLNWYDERLDPQWFMSAPAVTEVRAGEPTMTSARVD